jgi:hypothetical protein
VRALLARQIPSSLSSLVLIPSTSRLQAAVVPSRRRLPLAASSIARIARRLAPSLASSLFFSERELLHLWDPF